MKKPKPTRTNARAALQQAGKDIAMLEDLVKQVRYQRDRAKRALEKYRENSETRLDNVLASTHEKQKSLREEIRTLTKELRDTQHDRSRLCYQAQDMQRMIAALENKLSGFKDIEAAKFKSIVTSGEEIARYRMMLEHTSDFLRDLENRHLLECHDCGKDVFRWKSISIARDFLSLKGLVKPFGRKDKDITMVRPDFPSHTENKN